MFGTMGAQLTSQRMQRDAVRAMQQERLAYYAHKYAAKGWRLIEIYEPSRGQVTIRVQRPTTIPRVQRKAVA